MENIEVTARFSAEGEVTPLSFTWQDQTYPITSTGRQWKDEAGQHFLVMVPGDQIFELIFSPAFAGWRLGSFRTQRSAA